MANQAFMGADGSDSIYAAMQVNRNPENEHQSQRLEKVQRSLALKEARMLDCIVVKDAN